MDGMAMGGLAPPFLGVERSVCGRLWRLREADANLAAAISERHGLPEIVGRLLAERGVGIDGAPGFLAPRLRDGLPDPLHLRDMDRAVARLLRAVQQDEPIVVFGDYDVDGATSAALLLRFFAAAGARASVYVPDRMREGYGPNAPALLRLKADGAAVVVTVDCGATAHEPLAAAAEAGLDVIVVDHHVTEPLLPCALAVVHPKPRPHRAPRAGSAAMARPGCARHGMRRGAAEWAEPRPRGARHPGGAPDEKPGHARARRRGFGERPGRRLPARVCARPAGQCRWPGRRRRSRRTAAGHRRPGPRRRTGAAPRRLQPRAPRDRGAHRHRGDRAGRSDAAIAGIGVRCRRGLASGRYRHRRGAAQGAL